ncbi:MAG: hypothetical protein CSB32_01210 [Desulfobacterales bacterium]|nr:MAG: hypothetical protein CSB32_01210 [Desulfobacterales bacterium]
MTRSIRYFFFFTGAAVLLFLGACTRHEVDIQPVEIKPIHITIDVNVKVDRALDDFFGDLDEATTE